MTSFSESIREGAADLIERERNHGLLALIAQGRLPDERLRFLLGQVHLFGNEYERYLSSLIARAPREVRRSFVEAMMNLNLDSDLFEEAMRQSGVDPSAQKMSLPCRSFVDFLFTMVTVQSFPEAICAGYGAADSVREFWKQAKQCSRAELPWHDIVEMWSGDPIQGWITAVSRAIDRLAENYPPSTHEKMSEAYRHAIHYHLRVLDHALGELVP